VLAKLFAKADLRKIGSGSTGATNALRAGGKWIALATLLLDAAKPLLAWYFVCLLWSDSAKFSEFETNLKILVSAVAILAHCFPVYLRFKGGKGVATAWGTMWLFSPWLALVAIGVWIVVLAATKKSSLSALVAAALVPLWAYVFEPEAVWFYVGVVVFVILRHASNIKRLIAGTESKVDFKSGKKNARGK
jgi:glycerol-3-phosphate acyltransferase PlsY